MITVNINIMFLKNILMILIFYEEIVAFNGMFNCLFYIQCVSIL